TPAMIMLRALPAPTLPHARPAARSTNVLEQLILAAEDLADRAIAEDAADRVGQQVGARELADVRGSARTKRNRVGDDDLLELRGGEVLEGGAAHDGVRRGGVDGARTGVE